MIVLAEHLEARRKELIGLISELGHAVTAISTARELIWNLKNTTVKLLILNPELPDFGDRAFDFLTKLRSRYSRQELPVLMVCQPSWKGVLMAGFRAGINDLVLLPLDAETTRARLSHHLAMKKEYDDLCHQLARSQELKHSQQASFDRTVTFDPAQLAEAEIDANQTVMVDPSEIMTGHMEDTLPEGAEPNHEDAGTGTLPNPGTARARKGETVPEGTVLSLDNKTVVYESQTDPARLYDNDPDRHVPCELPLQFEAEERSSFAKSIWIARREMLVLVFEELPPAERVRIQMYDTQGSKVTLDARETTRQKVEDGAEGAYKVHLELVDASENYESLFFLLQKTYHQEGLAGLKSAFPGGSSPEEHYARNLGSTMAFSASELSLSLMKGFRYKFEKRLGKGSFASVYLVRDMVLKREVAMKVLGRQFSRESAARMSFLSEAQIAAQFHHPNIVFVYEVGEIRADHYEKYLSFPGEVLTDHPDRFIYFTMQHVEGENLRHWLEKNPMPDVTVLVGMWIQITEALAYAHAKGVVHRDIKPENILITAENRPLVADFGIATLTLEDDSSEESLRTACTPKYASPEQLEGHTLDKRTDLYSLGVIAYEMLAGKAPFNGRSVTQLAYQHLEEQPEPIGRMPNLEAIIMKCLAKDPDQRFDDAETLLTELRKIEGSRTGVSHERTLEKDLTGMVHELVTASNREKAGDALERVTSFLNLHKTDDDVELIKEIKQRVTEPSLIELILQKNLCYENLHILTRFFNELSTSRVVSTLLQWFTREPDARKKQWLGELALISVGRDLMPLVDFGLELPDHDACSLLKCFAKRMPKTRDTIFLRWSLHGGYHTQMELLKIIKELEGRDTEILNILNLYANGNGTRHPKVREIANLLLEGRLLLI